MKKSIVIVLVVLVLAFCVLLLRFYAAKESKIYFSVSSGVNSIIVEPIVIKVNSEPIGVLKNANSNFFADITQFLIRGENSIEIKSIIDLKISLSNDTEELKVIKEVKNNTIIKFQIQFEPKSIFKNADTIDKNYSLSEFIKHLRNSDRSILELQNGLAVQDQGADSENKSKQLTAFYEEYIKNCTFILNETAYLVIGNKYAEAYSKSKVPNEDYILLISKKGSEVEFKVDKVSFCFINGKIQLIDFVVYGGLAKNKK